MFLTKLPLLNKSDDDYKYHQYVKGIFCKSEKVLFQKADDVVFVLSSEKSMNECEEISLRKYNVGDNIPFIIRLNPTKTDIKTGKRVRLETDKIKTWINKTFTNRGCDIKFQYIIEGTRRSIRDNETISLFSILCFGNLVIKDVNCFYNTLTTGIGHGKGLGFGLLNIFL
jgi:CRISPR-associated protein Cas6/Cse3/CasE subtype I-E